MTMKRARGRRATPSGREFGARVRIEDSNGSGQIVIEYADSTALQALVDRLLGETR